jgi:hypothetical protein
MSINSESKEETATSYHDAGLDDLKQTLGELELARDALFKLSQIDIEGMQRDIVYLIAEKTNSLDLKGLWSEIYKAEKHAVKAHQCIQLCNNVLSKMAMDHLERAGRKVKLARENMDYSKQLRGETLQDIVDSPEAE